MFEKLITPLIMFWPLLVLLLGALILVWLLNWVFHSAKIRRKRYPRIDEAAGGGREIPLTYRRKDYLLSQAERSFYEVLRVALEGSDLQIFPKVRLWDLLWLPAGTPDRRAQMNRVTSKHVDVVICNRQHLRPMLVIELDDKSHDLEDRQARDVFVDAALAAAGLPILHCSARRAYHTRELAQKVYSAIGASIPELNAMSMNWLITGGLMSTTASPFAPFGGKVAQNGRHGASNATVVRSGKRTASTRY
jgi:hypothetical protein